MVRRSSGRLAAMVLALAIVGSGARVSAQEQARLVLLAGNEAGVPADILNRAKELVVRIYKNAGVEVTWSRVPAAASHAGPAQMFVMIVPPKLGTRMAVNPGAMGVAVTSSNTRGRLSYVFYERVTTVAAHADMDIAQVLGHAIAHEIGHLLLPAGHTAIGLMRAYWNKEDLADAALGRLLFTDDEAQAIRTRLK